MIHSEEQETQLCCFCSNRKYACRSKKELALSADVDMKSVDHIDIKCGRSNIYDIFNRITLDAC